MLSISANELLKKTDNKASYQIDKDFAIDDDQVKTLDDISGKLELQLRNNFVIATGNFKSSVELVCDRCTNNYTSLLEFDFDEAIEVSEKEILKDEVEFDSEDVHEHVSADEQIDVVDLLRQYVLLNMPMKSLCSEDCVNEKLEKFNSEKSDIDPRLEKLILYKDKIKET